MLSPATEGGFPETRWTRVLAVQNGVGSSPDADKALSELCEIYWLPIYAYARRRGESPHEAEDSTQEFFSMVLSRELFAKADKDIGKLRTFLLGAFNIFSAERNRAAKRLKRGGGQRFVPLDTEIGEHFLKETRTLPADQRPEFDRLWALTVLRRAMRQVEDEYYKRNQLRVFDRLRPYIGFDDTPDESEVAEHAKAMVMSEGAVRVAIHRLRQRFRRKIEDELAQTMRSRQEVEEEIRYLIEILPSGANWTM